MDINSIFLRILSKMEEFISIKRLMFYHKFNLIQRVNQDFLLITWRIFDIRMQRQRQQILFHSSACLTVYGLGGVIVLFSSSGSRCCIFKMLDFEAGMQIPQHSLIIRLYSYMFVLRKVAFKKSTCKYNLQYQKTGVGFLFVQV